MISEEQKRWAVEFLRDINFDYTTLHIINLNSLVQARDIVIEMLGDQHREITELKKKNYELKEQVEVLNGAIYKVCDWGED